MEVVDGRLTGAMSTPSCRGPEKAVRLAGHKLPVKTKFVTRDGVHAG